jgi:hypothetical protein
MKTLVVRILESALWSLFHNQPTLSRYTETYEHEPNLSFHLANELWPYLRWLDCDFDVKKENAGLKRPDLIFHRRASNALNFLVVEVKRASNRHGVEEDIERIRTFWFRGRLQYTFGASVVIDETAQDSEFQLFENDLHDKPLLQQVKHTSLASPLHAPSPIDIKTLHPLTERIVAAERANTAVEVKALKEKLDERIYSLYGPREGG